MTALVLLHGFLGGPESWARFATALRHSGPVHAPRLFGHGQPPREVPPDFWGAVDALADEIPPRAIVIGYSLGGRLALGLACRHGERLAGVVAIGARPGITDAAERGARVSWEDELAEALERGGIERFVERWEALPLFASQRELPSALLAAQRRLRTSHDPRALGKVLRNLGTGRMPVLPLDRAKAPVALLAGEHDPRRGALHAPVPGAGHNPLLEAPEALVRIIRDQLARWSSPLENHP